MSSRNPKPHLSKAKPNTMTPHHPDDGCAVGGPSCLDCPLPACVYGLPAAETSRLFKLAMLAAATGVVRHPQLTPR